MNGMSVGWRSVGPELPGRLGSLDQSLHQGRVPLPRVRDPVLGLVLPSSRAPGKPRRQAWRRGFHLAGQNPDLCLLCLISSNYILRCYFTCCDCRGSWG
jgi:hypothetical protein